MTATILTIIAGLLAAIPIAWAWSQSRAKKKAAKELVQRKVEISKAVHSGDLAAVQRTLAKWL